MIVLSYCLFKLQSGCLLTFICLSFYVLSNRIRILNTLISASVQFKPKAFDCGWIVTPATLANR